MANQPLPPIADNLDELRRRLHNERDPKLKPRLHLLVLIKAEQVSTRQQAAAHLAVHRNTISNWLKLYQEAGLEHLLRLKEPGAPAGQRCLPEPVFEALKRQLQDRDGFASYGEVQQWLCDEFGQELPYKTVHGLVRYRLKAKLKRARPSHAKKTSPIALALSNT